MTLLTEMIFVLQATLLEILLQRLDPDFCVNILDGSPSFMFMASTATFYYSFSKILCIGKAYSTCLSFLWNIVSSDVFAGGVALVFSIIWPVLVTKWNSPEEHPFISEKEKNYVVQSIQRDGQSKASKEEVRFLPKSI